jgi:hypothetical protein
MPRFRPLNAAAMAILPAMVLSPADAQSGTHPVAPLSPAWHLSVNWHYGQPGNASGFSEILLAGREVWAFGGTNPGGPSSPVAMFLDGRSWRDSRLPTGLTGFISSASAPDSRDIWAISNYGRYVLHWNGKHWYLARRWSQQGPLSGVVAISHQNVWVFGTSAYGVRATGTWHFDGRSWVPAAKAAQDIYRASAASARDIWAIAAGQHADSIERFNGRAWRHVRTGRILEGIRWHDILALSGSDVWILGDAANKHGSGTLVLAHWNGRRWTRFRTSLEAWAGQLAAVGSGRVAATAVSSGLVGDGLILEMTDRGQLTWSTIGSSLGSGVSDVAYARRSHTLWASGGILTRLGGNAAIWTFAVPHVSQAADQDED